MQQRHSEQLQEFLDRHARIAVLTGAGCSTASGIPEYRDDDGEWKHARPVQYADFLNSTATRQRYWARSFSGWQRFNKAVPNLTHTALARLDEAGRINGLITQNVDNLHRRAGSRGVIDLHGILDRVRCLSCEEISRRSNLQDRLRDANPDWVSVSGDARPDGDVELGPQATDAFKVPDCVSCGGILKPDVVFFGETVPPERVLQSQTLVAESDALLVVGSSLMVFSGFRFVRQAHAAGKAIAILNRGKTRADDLASLRINDDCGVLLAACSACSKDASGPFA
ncbi:MAG: NAD-dependent protein deacetylase [Woeseia sp.]|nr:NAD-dependent protein deacetylase [Woeseia sp.]NNE62415.1 NAD-dependent protein deacetylase [Woeseia sp.]NNL54137.1 NAD-dependent protein deacetylase [Woeseia sp.]